MSPTLVVRFHNSVRGLGETFGGSSASRLRNCWGEMLGGSLGSDSCMGLWLGGTLTPTGLGQVWGWFGFVASGDLKPNWLGSDFCSSSAGGRTGQAGQVWVRVRSLAG